MAVEFHRDLLVCPAFPVERHDRLCASPSVGHVVNAINKWYSGDCTTTSMTSRPQRATDICCRTSHEQRCQDTTRMAPIARSATHIRSVGGRPNLCQDSLPAAVATALSMHTAAQARPRARLCVHCVSSTMVAAAESLC